MITAITAVFAIFAYLAVGRTVFWGLSRLDWPKSTSWDCGRDHTHAYHGCTKSRDVTKSRDCRVGLTYFWPVMFPLTIIAGVLAASAVGVHTVMTKPITTPAERTARRLALEAEVRSAEAELEKTKEVTPTKITPAQQSHVSVDEWERHLQRRLEYEQQRIARGY